MPQTTKHKTNQKTHTSQLNSDKFCSLPVFHTWVTVISLCLKSQVAYWGLGSVLLGFGFCQYIIWDETDTICYGVPCGIITTTLWPNSKLESTNVVGCGYIEKNAFYKRLTVNSSFHYKDPITIKP